MAGAEVKVVVIGCGVASGSLEGQVLHFFCSVARTSYILYISSLLLLSISLSSLLSSTISRAREMWGGGSHCRAVVIWGWEIVAESSPVVALLAASQVSMPCFRPHLLPSLEIGWLVGRHLLLFMMMAWPVQIYSCAAGQPQTQ